jgi:hypothetical protein
MAQSRTVPIVLPAAEKVKNQLSAFTSRMGMRGVIPKAVIPMRAMWNRSLTVGFLSPVREIKLMISDLETYVEAVSLGSGMHLDLFRFIGAPCNPRLVSCASLLAG